MFWKSKPLWSMPPQISFLCMPSTTCKISGILCCGNIAPCHLFVTVYFLHAIGHELFCPRIQYKATELSSQQCVLLTGSPSRASLTLSTRFTAMLPETSSNRRMVSPCLDSPDLAAIRPWLVPDTCRMTA